MDAVEWVRRIRAELLCGVVRIEGLQYAMEVTLVRYVDGEECSLVMHIKFDELDEAGEVVLESVISDFKIKFPSLDYPQVK